MCGLWFESRYPYHGFFDFRSQNTLKNLGWIGKRTSGYVNSYDAAGVSFDSPVVSTPMSWNIDIISRYIYIYTYIYIHIYIYTYIYIYINNFLDRRLRGQLRKKPFTDRTGLLYHGDETWVGGHGTLFARCKMLQAFRSAQFAKTIRRTLR